MKNYPSESSIKNETNITPTNSLLNAGTAVATGPGHWLAKCKIWLWLALPLTLAAGCASNPNRAAVADKFFTAVPVASTEPVSERQAANVVVGNEVFYMFMSNTNADCSLTAMVNEGLVTLGGVSFVGVERQSIIDQTWGLVGVTQVQNELGVDLISTPKAIAMR